MPFDMRQVRHFWHDYIHFISYFFLIDIKTYKRQWRGLIFRSDLSNHSLGNPYFHSTGPSYIPVLNLEYSGVEENCHFGRKVNSRSRTLES